jgi:hypothetical protein
MNREKFIIVLRWIGILPCAVLALLLSYLLISLFNRLPVNTDSWIVVYILPLICAYISGFAYMTVGILIAPSRTRTVAIILSGILLIVLGIGVTSVMPSKQYFELIKYASAVIGSNIAYFSLKDAVEQ